MSKLTWYAGQTVGTWFRLVKGLVFLDVDGRKTVEVPIREALKAVWQNYEELRHESNLLSDSVRYAKREIAGLLETLKSRNDEIALLRRELERYRDLERATAMHSSLPQDVGAAEVASLASYKGRPYPSDLASHGHREYARGGLVGQPPTAVPPSSLASDTLITLAMVNSASIPVPQEIVSACAPRADSHSSVCSSRDVGSSSGYSSSSSDSSSSSSNDY